MQLWQGEHLLWSSSTHLTDPRFRIVYAGTSHGDHALRNLLYR